MRGAFPDEDFIGAFGDGADLEKAEEFGVLLLAESLSIRTGDVPAFSAGAAEDGVFNVDLGDFGEELAAAGFAGFGAAVGDVATGEAVGGVLDDVAEVRGHAAGW